MTHLRGHTPESLVAHFPGLPEAVARRVLHRLLFEDHDVLGEVPGLSRRWRETLLEEGRLERLQVLDRRRSAIDPFVKYLFRAADGRRFEAVRIPLERPRWSACVSSQAGCAFGCRFCETGRLGLERSLEAWEMVEQALTVRREGPERPLTGIVFQGQGEPLQNYDAVLRAAGVLRHPCGLRIGADRITISTVGLLPAIERYADEAHPYRLMLSIGSAFQERRESLLPVARRYEVEALAAAMRRLACAQGGVVSLAWVLIAGLNTGPEEARELARLFPGVRVRLSVIDVNDPTGRYRRASDDERARFLSALADSGIGFVRRYSGGADIHAACGMLAAQTRGGREYGPAAAGEASPPSP